MKFSFWLKRFSAVFVSVFIVLAGVYLLRGRETKDALSEALIWSSVSTIIFAVTSVYYVRRGISCALCNDLPASPNKAPRSK